MINELQIGINLTDPIFRGEYHGKQRHDDDFEDVIQRGLDAGCKRFMVTGSDLEESKHAVEISKAHRTFCYNRYQAFINGKQQIFATEPLAFIPVQQINSTPTLADRQSSFRH